MPARTPLTRLLLPTVLLTVLIAGTATAGSGGPRSAPAAGRAPVNINVSREPGNQSETTIAIQATNPQRMVVVSNEESVSGMFHGWSTDGGRTWNADRIADGDNLGTACCDPSLWADEFGNIFLTWLSSSGQIRVALSTDGGASFSSLAVIHPLGRAGAGPIGRAPRSANGALPTGDQPSITAGHGAVWVTWTGSNSIQASGAAVTGLGQVAAFSPPQNAQGQFKAGGYGDVAIGPNGQVMIVYQNPTGGQGPATIYTAVDADGLGPNGFSPSVITQVTNVGGFDYIPAQSGRSVDAETELQWDRSGGPHRGRLYLLYTSEQPQESNDMDIQVRFSDDDGVTWSPSVRVNDDSGTTSQFNPRIALDQTTGNLAVAWYDARNDRGDLDRGDTNGVPNDDAMIYGTVSKDGGQSFAPNIRLSVGVSNDDQAHNGIDYGDYEGLAFHRGVYFYVWADNSNSTGDNPNGTLNELDIYTARVRVP